MADPLDRIWRENFNSCSMHGGFGLSTVVGILLERLAEADASKASG